MFTADHIYIKITDKDCASLEANVMNYHNNSVDKDGVRGDFIGIGVKSTVVPALAASNEASSSSETSYPDTSYGIKITPSDVDGTASSVSGTFTIADCDPDDFTGAKLDGKLLLKGSSYFIESLPGVGITLRLSDALLSSLSDGQHSLHVYFTDGDGEISFDTASLSALSPVAGVPATGSVSHTAPVLLMLAVFIWQKRKVFHAKE